jgi:hypothetical protein
MSKHVHPLDDDSHPWFVDDPSKEGLLLQLKFHCLFIMLGMLVSLVLGIIAFALGDGASFH